MKNLFISTILIFLSLLSKNAKSQIDTTFEILKRIDYASYVRKPVDSLLQTIPNNYLSLKIRASHIPYNADHVAITYNNGVHLSIYVHDFQFMNPFWDYQINNIPAWDLNLFKKEGIAYSVLFRGPICYVGCDRAYDY